MSLSILDFVSLSAEFCVEGWGSASNFPLSVFTGPVILCTLKKFFQSEDNEVILERLGGKSILNAFSLK